MDFSNFFAEGSAQSVRDEQELDYEARKFLGLSKRLFLPKGLVYEAAAAHRKAEEARKKAERETADKAKSEQDELGGDSASAESNKANPFSHKKDSLEVTLAQANAYVPESSDIKVFPEETLLFDRWKTNADRNDRNQQAKVLFEKMLRNNGYRRLHLIDLAAAEDAFNRLRNQFPNFAEAIDVLHDAWVLAHAAPYPEAINFPAIILDGPPGVGKTLFCEALARALMLPCRIIPVASVGGGFVLGGTDQHWSNAQPGRIWDALANEDVCNPIVVLDEMDKSGGGDDRYNFQDALLPLLESRTARSYEDVCLEAKFDASKIVFVATSNDLSRVSEPLRSRMHVIGVSAPDAEQRMAIARAIFDDVLLDKIGVPMTTSNAAVEQLATLPVSPREMRKIVERTAARFLRSNPDADEIVIDKIEAPRLDARQKVGFV